MAESLPSHWRAIRADDGERLCCILRREFRWISDAAMTDMPDTMTLGEFWDGPAVEQAPTISALRTVGVPLTAVYDLLYDMLMDRPCDHG